MHSLLRCDPKGGKPTESECISLTLSLCSTASRHPSSGTTWIPAKLGDIGVVEQWSQGPLSQARQVGPGFPGTEL